MARGSDTVVKAKGKSSIVAAQTNSKVTPKLRSKTEKQTTTTTAISTSLKEERRNTRNGTQLVKGRGEKKSKTQERKSLGDKKSKTKAERSKKTRTTATRRRGKMTEEKDSETAMELDEVKEEETSNGKKAEGNKNVQEKKKGGKEYEKENKAKSESDKEKEDDKKSNDKGRKSEEEDSSNEMIIETTALHKSATSSGSRKRPAPEQAESREAKRVKVVIERVKRHNRGAGKVLTVGQGDVGQLGLGDTCVERQRPSFVQMPDEIVDICAGGMHTVCLSKDGKVFTFGCNDEGALGRDTSEEGSEFVPCPVEIDGKVIQISAGDSHTAVLTDQGRVFAWGTFRDSSGSMGLLNGNIQMTPHRLLEDIPVSKVASGSDHLVLLTTAGQIYTCGCAEQGQLGRVAECFSSRGGRKGLSLLLNPGLAVVRRLRGKQPVFDRVWTGAYSTFLRVKDSGEIYVCGLNNYYQLGSKNTTSHFVFEKSESFRGKRWIQISGGQHHTLALDENGTVYCLGRKEYGRLGLGENTDDISQPTVISSLAETKCVDISGGVATSYALTEDGNVYAWGMGTNGALGTGNEDDQHTPMLMQGKQLEGQKAIAVSSGGQHAVLLVLSKSLSSTSSSNE